jgi:hypothetical protein
MASSKDGERHTTPLHMQLESVGKAAEVYDGFWIVATRHRPGLSRHIFEINNRALVFRLFDSNLVRPVLVVVNAVDPSAIPEVKALEKRTGLAVRFIASPGGGHHLLIEPWHDAFTSAQVLLPPVRIPRTEHGKRLMKLPRVATLDPEDPLPQFKGQLEAVLFRGLLGPTDRPTPAEGASDTRLGFFRGMFHVMTSVKDPVDELWLFHVPSGTVIGGENLGWFYPAEELRGQPMMLRGMIKPDKLWIQKMARKTGNAEQVAACWRRILAWPARAAMTYHDPIATAFMGDAQAALTEAVRAAGQLRG